MHKIAISDAARQRMMARTGKTHPFDEIDPRQAALVVIDMQNYFCKPGHQGEVPASRDIVPNINRLAADLRRRGGLVVWVRNGTHDTRESWSNYHEFLHTPERCRTALCGDGGRRRRLRLLASERHPAGGCAGDQDALQRFHPGLFGYRTARCATAASIRF